MSPTRSRRSGAVVVVTSLGDARGHAPVERIPARTPCRPREAAARVGRHRPQHELQANSRRVVEARRAARLSCRFRPRADGAAGSPGSTVFACSSWKRGETRDGLSVLLSQLGAQVTAAARRRRRRLTSLSSRAACTCCSRNIASRGEDGYALHPAVAATVRRTTAGLVPAAALKPPR